MASVAESEVQRGSLKLWPHQVRARDEVIAAVKAGERRLCVTAPTGSGKTVIMVELVRWAVENGWPVVLYTNRRMLFEQTCGVMEESGIWFGRRASGHDPALTRDVQISSMPTEHARVFRSERWDSLHKARLVLVDEAHLQKAATAEAIIQRHIEDGAAVVGFTATPLGIGHLYERLFVACTNSEARQCGALVWAHQLAPDEPEAKVVRKQLWEWTENDVRKVVRLQVVFGRIWDCWRRYNPDAMPTLGFAPGVPESLWAAKEFYRRGCRAAHIDGENVWINGEMYRSSDEIRGELRKAIEDGDVTVVFNRYVMREGIDLPNIAVGILATVFTSVTSYIQACGRLLRSHPSLESVTVLDHAGNWWRMGQYADLNADKSWRLDQTSRRLLAWQHDAMREGKLPQSKKCAECEDGIAFGRHRLCEKCREKGRNCPKCNAWLSHEMRVEHRGECPFCGWIPSPRPRVIIQESGELKYMRGNALKPRRRAMRPGWVNDWRQAYFRIRHVDGTFLQAEALFAKEHNWWWPPRDLPLMPKDAGDWPRKISDIAESALVEDREELVGAIDMDVVVPFGKHKGKRISEIPVGYARWLAGLDDLERWRGLKAAVQEVLEKKG